MRVWAAFWGMLASLAVMGSAYGADRPNILWLTADDMSPDMGCYGDAYAKTPNLDRLAIEGARYTSVFSVHGQCSPSRSALVTGMYPTTMGTHHMRCAGIPPAYVKCFTEYLRAAGYYCTNNRKTDYNFGYEGTVRQGTSKAPLGAWDENGGDAHWRGRGKGQPFFSVFNFPVTHESRIFAPDEKAAQFTKELTREEFHDPDHAPLPPYYPDHPTVRHDVARYYDLVTAMDKQVARVLAQLEEDGLADNTIVMFFADHGRGLPRAKRWIYDSGIRVPLIIRWPDRLEPGTVDARLISFVDFAPTMLSIAGVAIPDYMQGKAFLGPADDGARDYIFAARDHYDEVVDFTRAVRDGRFKYIRNFRPEIPYSVEVSYMDQMPMMQVWRRLHAERKLSGPPADWFRDRRPAEELYDLETDPHEIRNVAEEPRFSAVVKRMRGALERWQARTKDLGVVSEEELWEERRPGGEWAKTANPTVRTEPLGPGEEVRVTLACATEGSTIVYTTEGGAKAHWKLYTEPITVSVGATLRVQAGRIGYLHSDEIRRTIRRADATEQNDAAA